MFDMPMIEHCEDLSLKADGCAHEGQRAAELGLKGIPGAAESIMAGRGAPPRARPEGHRGAELGLKGIPGAAESIMAARDVLLAEMTGGHVHIAHMSAWTTLEAVRQGKSRQGKVTCEVAPHHFTLTDDLLAAPVAYDTNTKMNPPLREARDRDAMITGIADGTVDVISTDNAQHHYEEKTYKYD